MPGEDVAAAAAGRDPGGIGFGAADLVPLDEELHRLAADRVIAVCSQQVGAERGRPGDGPGAATGSATMRVGARSTVCTSTAMLGENLSSPS